MTLLIEFEAKRDGKVYRKLAFSCQRKDFVVYEQVLRLVGGVVEEWNNAFVETFPNRELARTFFMGRILTMAHEEGNSEDLNPAILNYASSSAIMADRGSHK